MLLPRCVKLLLASLCAALSASMSFASAAVTPIFDNTGLLIGAKNIDVNGLHLDVLFSLGSCASLFNGCDDWNDFVFTTEPAFVNVAYNASNEIMNQVFVDGPSGNFDSDIDSVFGCSSNSSAYCQFFIPIGLLSDGSPWVIANANSNDVNDNSAPSFGGLAGPPNFAQGSNMIWAVLTPSAPISEVPLPAAASFFLAGLGGFSLLRRRRA